MPALDEDPEHTNGRPATRRPTLDQHGIRVWQESQVTPLLLSQKRCKKVSNQPDSTQASDEDAEHAIGCVVSKRLTLDHNMVYVPGKNLIFLPVYVHETQK
jgi:hypothetical protein